jgi:hypothetical protein
MDDTFFIIYKISNKINNKIYIGAHVTKHVNDNYMGSGTALNRAKKKYGLDNFVKEILYVFDNEQEMWDKECEIVTEDFCKQQDNYNVRIGGIGGWNHWNGSDAHKAASRQGGRTSVKKLNEFIAEQKVNNTEWWQNWYANVVEQNRTKNNNGWSNFSPEEYEQRRQDASKKSSGSRNSQFGRIWISNVLTKEVRRISINDSIPEGWVRGKKGHVIKECWVNNGTKEHFILLDKKQEYLDKGFIAGRLKTSVPQKQNSMKVEV